MTIPFLAEEIDQRRCAVARTLAGRALDAVVCLQPESIYWLVGAQPVAGALPGCLLVEAGGDMTLLADPDRFSASKFPSTAVRAWTGRAGAVDLAMDLCALLDERGLGAARLGLEPAPAAQPAGALAPLAAALRERAAVVDASDLVRGHRALKEPRELAWIRRAAGLADDALDAALARAGAGARPGAIRADMRAAITGGGGDEAAGEFVAEAAGGPAGNPDRLELEWAGMYRRYQAPMARTLLVGAVDRPSREMHALAADALAAALDACRPGTACGAIFAAAGGLIDAAGWGAARPADCGHAVGTSFAPGATDGLLLAPGSAEPLQAGMALLLRIALRDPDSGRGLRLGQTVEITEAGAVSLHRHGLDPLHV